MKHAFLAFVLLASLPSWGDATTPHTITVDGDVSDFAPDEQVFSDSTRDSNWDFNELYGLFLTWDADALYLGVSGRIEQSNSYSVYLDTGAGSTATDLSSVAWEKQMYAQGWACDFSVQASGEPDYGAFRVFADWDEEEVTAASGVQLAINAGAGQFEARIPWNVLYRNGVPANGRVKAVAALTGLFEWDCADTMPNQTVGPIGDGVPDYLDVTYQVNFDDDGDGTPESGWHPNTNSAGGNQPPVVSISADPLEGAAPLEVDFFGTVSDPGDTISGLTWDFGDGTNAAESAVLHTFEKPGTYQVTLSARDDEGAEGFDSVTVIVHPAAGAATLSLSTASHVYHQGDTFKVDLSLETGAADVPVELYVVLEAFGNFYFWPSFGPAPEAIAVTLPPNFSIKFPLLEAPLTDPLPDAGPMHFYAVFVQPGTGNLIGELASTEFSFSGGQ